MLSLTAGLHVNGQGQQAAAPTPQVELKQSENGLNVARAKESFSSLSLEGSDLQAAPPLPGGTAKTADFTRELVRVQWRPNDPIDLYVIRPLTVNNPPVVLYLYSFPTDTDRFRDDRYCQRLVQNGAAAVGFVSALTGQRIRGNRPLKEWFISELPESLATTVHDVQMIVNYLDTRGDMDMTRVGMFGQGSGAAIAVLAAAADPRLKALDLFNPWGDWPDWLATSSVAPKEERDRYLKPDFLKPLEHLEPTRFLGGLKSRPIRIQFVDNEIKDTKEAAAKIEAAAPATAKTIHYPNGRAMYAVSSDGRLFEWIATALKSGTETKEPAAKTASRVTAK